LLLSWSSLDSSRCSRRRRRRRIIARGVHGRRGGVGGDRGELVSGIRVDCVAVVVVVATPAVGLTR